MTLDRDAARRALARPATGCSRFDPAALDGLPEPAQRFLAGSIRPGVVRTPGVEVEMEGEIRLRGWVPFRARQVLRAGEGFVWEATARKGPIVVSGGDALWDGSSSLDFRLFGLIPVVRASGPDIVRSAAGRLAAEVVAWAPHALVDAEWRAVDDGHATVAVPVPEGTIDVTVAVSPEGTPTEISLRRWGDPDGEPFDEYPFGAATEELATFDGITIPSAGTVGWHWGTDRQDEGAFFRYRITGAKRIAS